MERAMIQIPEVVRIKPGALKRLGLYLARARNTKVFLAISQGIRADILEKVRSGFSQNGISEIGSSEVADNRLEIATDILASLPTRTDAVVGLGGGKALDVAKYVASAVNLPYYAVPTSLSNDGFCSPQSSLVLAGRRKSLHTRLPNAVIIDSEVVLDAPVELWCSGVGDLVAKITAVADWKLAFHARGEPVNDFAALLSDATVYQFLARPAHDVEGARFLGTALMLNGIAMEIAGSSRPASGSEHLLSHALDSITPHPRLHGLQVGIATYLVANLQKNPAVSSIADLFTKTKFWETVAANPFSRAEWLEAAELAPTVKGDYYTILSARDCLPEIGLLLNEDIFLRRCFTE
jgi:glycerol-1-phosphate dehydrogenase [NAD(P)+]